MSEKNDLLLSIVSKRSGINIRKLKAETANDRYYDAEESVACGYADAATIKNNCDRTVYLGGTDMATCSSMAKRMDVPVCEVQNMPLGRVVVLERGSRPKFADRYAILKDPDYITLQKTCMKSDKEPIEQDLDRTV